MNDKLSKANFAIDGDQISVTMPFAKVDKEQRLVSGFASLDNIDKQGDVVDADASVRAFSTTQARIREMHRDDLAVGRIDSFKEQEYYDPDTNKTYKGVYVTAYVSKGAQDTWEKVLDGTLSGFSIGGKIIHKEFVKMANADKPVRYIKEYVLNELSLVDNPANQFATIFSIQKNDSGEDIIKGIAADASLETVFYCNADEIAIASTDETKSCVSCDKPMTNIGWFERVENDDDNTTKFSTVVNKYATSLQNNHEDGNIIIKQEGGNNMSEAANENETTEEVTDAATDENLVVDETEVAEEEAVPAVEEVEGADLEKMFSDLQAKVIEALTKSSDAKSEEITAVKTEVEEVVKGLAEQVAALAETTASITEKLDSLNKSVEAVEGRVEDVVKGTATKKSGDQGGSTGESFQKDDAVWGNFFDVRTK